MENCYFRIKDKEINEELIEICILLMDICNKDSILQLENKLKQNNITLYKKDGSFKSLYKLFDELNEKFC